MFANFKNSLTGHFDTIIEKRSYHMILNKVENKRQFGNHLSQNF